MHKELYKQKYIDHITNKLIRIKKNYRHANSGYFQGI